MNISIFDVLGPVMIGPSSSHTAGAARLARVAAALAPVGFVKVCFGLSGSFAKTGRGHGTHKALLAGALGVREDQEALRDAFALAQEKGLVWEFTEVDLPDSHENAVRITFCYADDSTFVVEGASTGGGRICITLLDDMETEFTAEAPTLVIRQRDVKGVLSKVTGLLAENNINIGVMRVTRTARGKTASCVIETDANVPPELLQRIARAENVLAARAVDL